jgi:hypothetical protein
MVPDATREKEQGDDDSGAELLHSSMSFRYVLRPAYFLDR